MTDSYGVVPSGFNTKSFDEIRTSINQLLYEAFGTIRVDEESVFGQLIGVLTEPTAEEWLALESVYNSLNPNTATDFSLDNIAAYIGVKRLEATATTVEAFLTGVNQTVVPQGSEAVALGINTVFKLDNQVVLSNLGCSGIKLDFVFVEGNIYQLTISGHSYSRVAAPLEVKATVVNSLVSSINTSAIGVTATNVNDILTIIINDRTPINVTHNDNMFIVNVAQYANFTASDKGDIALPAGQLTIIQTPIGGWETVYNDSPGVIGRNLEIDDELRIRRERSLKLAGAGTVDAIRARVLNIEGVTAATVSENSTNATVDSLPAHSFETLVLGGLDQLIANAIWVTKPAGIATYGNVTNTIIDTAGKTHIVYFSRPVKLYIYVNVILTKDVSLYPINGDAVIKDAIAKQIMKLEVGEDVVYQSLYQSIYEVPGITAAVIQIGGSLVESPPALSSANVTVGSSQIAVSDITKITIA
jgi:uncharacterized phage protein gp47/JayE